MKQFEAAQKRTLILSAGIFILLTLGVLLYSYKAYVNAKEEALAEAQKQTRVLANRRAEEIADLLEEIYDDANYVYKNRTFYDLTLQYEKNIGDSAAQKNIADWLQAYQEDDQFDGVFLLDGQGNVLTSTIERQALNAPIREAAKQAIDSKQVTLIDLHRDERSGQIYFGLAIPIVDQNDAGSPAVGCVALRANAEDYLFAYLNAPAANSVTGGAFLVRVEEDSVVILSEIKNQSNVALRLKIPLSDQTNIAAQAALGARDNIEGVDSRGVEKIAAAQPIPHSHWILVASQDASEAYAPTYKYLWQNLVLVSSLVIAVGLGLALALRQRDLQFYRAEIESTERLRESQEELSKQHAYLQAAQEAGQIGAWEYDFEARRMTWAQQTYEIFGVPKETPLSYETFLQRVHPDDADYVDMRWQSALRGETYDIEHRILIDGQIRWIKEKAKWTANAEGKFTALIGIAQDVTEQKRIEENLRLLTQELDGKVRARAGELQKANQTLQQEKERAELLVNFSIMLLENFSDYRSLLQQVADGITRLIGDGCVIAFMSADELHLRAEAVSHRDPQAARQAQALIANGEYSLKTAKLSTLLVQSKKPFNYQALAYEQAREIFPAQLLPLLKKNGLTGVIGIPLTGRESALGVMFVVKNNAWIVPFKEDEVAYLRSLASPLSMSIENARLFESERKNREELRGYAQQLVSMQEKQVRRLAGELHDGIGQNLTAINVNLSVLEQLLREEQKQPITARIQDTRQIVEESVARIRNLMADFLPPMLERYGLGAALTWYAERFSARTNIPTRVKNALPNGARLPAAAEVGVFRILQEALNNIAKHAQAQRVEIELREESDGVIISISDDGVGFDLLAAQERPSHWGLTIMRERARAIDAALNIQSTRGKGTRLVLRLKGNLT
ncbi:MAG: hypothetical protein Fur002_13960 [Anaerolineales bacterium]